jgi:hypothetical protein
MSLKPLSAYLCALLLLAGCAQVDELLYGTSKPADPAAQAPASGSADAVYINPQAQASAASLRNVYIAPANFANMQVIQPEGASSDSEWWVTEEENQVLQGAITQEFAVALSYQSAFNIVYSRAQADIVVDIAVVALHPNEARGSLARRGNTGGAITVSIAVVNARSEQVLVRFVDSRPSDDIWAFNLVNKDATAINPIFRGWGDAIRRGLMQAQGRPAT